MEGTNKRGDLHSIMELYWLNQFSGELKKSYFPYDFKHNNNAFGSDEMKFKFSGELFSNLMKLSNGSDYRLHMALVAVLLVLLNKYTDKKDITVGVPVYKQKIEGELINTVLALRIQLEGHLSFKDILLQVRQSLVKAVENQNYPIELLIHHLKNQAPDDDSPLFDVAILLENIHEKEYIQHLNLNMCFIFNRTSESFEGILKYNPGLYLETSIKRIINHFSHLLEEVVFHVNTWISDLEMLSVEEKHQLLFDFNNTTVAYPKHKTLHGLFAEQVEQTPDHVALVVQITNKNIFISYTELNRKSNQLAHLLGEMGVLSDTIVGIMVERSMEMVIGILGILKAGGAYLPVDPDYPAERINYMLTDSSAKVLVTTGSLAEGCEKVRKYEGEKIFIDVCESHACLVNQQAVTRSQQQITRNEKRGKSLAYIMYTSGSTGKPKGTPVTHRNVNNYSTWFKREFQIGVEDKFCYTGSFCFDMSVTSLIVPLISGASLYTAQEKIEWDPQMYTHFLAENRISIVKLTPTQFRTLKDFIEDEDLSSLRYIILGGEAVDVNDVRNYLAIYNHQRIVNEYGPTETTVAAVFYVAHGKGTETLDKSNLPIGRPIFNTQINILDKYLKVVPIGVVGELCIGGEGVSRGYLNNPGLTAEKFILSTAVQGDLPGRIYCTGDLARFLLDGNIEFLGRMDYQVKIRGHRIELGEIECKLLKHEEIKEAVVLKREEKNRNKYLCAYFVSEVELSRFGLRKFLLKELSEYMIPLHFVQLEKIPLMPNGKIDRKALPVPELKAEGELIAPRDEIEEKMAQIWSEILGMEKDMIGIDLNFLEVGGHSLKATILAANIHKEFNVKLPLSKIFKTPNIRGLVELIKETTKYEFVPIEPAEKKEYYTLSSAQNRFYFIHLLEPESTAYNVPVLVILEGDLNRERLEETFWKLIDRHESLRTSFEIIGEEYVQRIHENVEFEIEYYQVEVKVEEKEGTRGLAPLSIPTTRNSQLATSTIKNFIRPFDLSRAPLLRVGLVKTQEKEHLLMVDIHHIVTDGFSQDVLTQDFLTFYAGEVLPTLRLQYKDFSQWQNLSFKYERRRHRERYWLHRFKGPLPVLHMPTDYPRPSMRRVDDGDYIKFKVEKPLAAKIFDLKEKTDTTLYMVLLAVYNIFLFKYTKDEDIVVGTPVAGRKHADLQEVIGLFLNMLPMRNYPAGHKTFRQFLEEVRKSSLDAYENEDYPFEELVAKLDLQGDPSRNPLFDTEFAIISRLPRKPKTTNLVIKPYSNNLRFAKFDLHFLAVETNDAIRFTLRYYTALFKRSTVEKMTGHYIEILKQVVENLEIKLNDIVISLDFLKVKSNILEEVKGDFEL